MNNRILLISIYTAIMSNAVFALDLNQIGSLDPVEEAHKVVAADNPYFIGMYGYSLMVHEVPGVSYCWEDAGLVKVVPNTSDSLLSEKDAKWQSLAGKFSRSFNKEVWKLMPELHSHKCAHNKALKQGREKASRPLA